MKKGQPSTGSTKTQRAMARFQQWEGMLQCPICAEALRTQRPRSLACSRKHTFDLARSGMVHLVAAPPKQQSYSSDLFAQRQRMHEAGLFQPLLQEVARQLQAHLQPGPGATLLLDAGCGSGFALSYVLDQMQSDNVRLWGLGIDLAKDGVQLAAKTYDGPAWAVADLANLPLAPQTCQGIINILSPSNYAEFRRVLTANGVLVKVLPGSAYLQEVRDVVVTAAGAKDYSNASVVARFCHEMRVVSQRSVRYVWALKPQQLLPLLAMSPLTWNADVERLADEHGTAINKITMDFVVLVGRTRADGASLAERGD